jgi:hypothetical protein
VVLTFPEDDYVLTTTPAPECTYSGGITNQSTSVLVTCTANLNTITISNFAQITKGELITVKVSHVLNPPKILQTGKFSVESVSDSNYLQDAIYTIPGISIV